MVKAPTIVNTIGGILNSFLTLGNIIGGIGGILTLFSSFWGKNQYFSMGQNVYECMGDILTIVTIGRTILTILITVGGIGRNID